MGFSRQEYWSELPFPSPRDLPNPGIEPGLPALQADALLSITNPCSSLRLMSIESVMPSSHLILCHPLLLRPPIPPSIRVFSNESTLHMRWPKYWSLSFSIGPSKEHPGLISFRMVWLDLLAVQGTLKSLLQHHSSAIRVVLSAYLSVLIFLLAILILARDSSSLAFRMMYSVCIDIK